MRETQHDRDLPVEVRHRRTPSRRQSGRYAGRGKDRPPGQKTPQTEPSQVATVDQVPRRSRL